MAKENKFNQDNKKHVAKRKQEEQTVKRMQTVGNIVFAAIALILVVGIVYTFLIVPPQAVAVVNGEKITTRQYQAKTQYARYNIVNQYQQAYQMYNVMGQFAPEYASQYLTQMYQLYFTMQGIGETSYQAIIQDEVTRQKAIEMGFTVTEEDIDAKIEELLGYYPDGAPDVTTAEPVPTSTLTDLQLTMVTPIPEVEPVEEETTEETAEEIEPTAIPTEYTADLYQDNVKMLYSNLRKQAGISEELFRYLIEMSLYVDMVKETYREDVGEPTEEVVWAKHILVETEAEALVILEKLDDGEAWDDLALEFSLDESNKASGGNLGWFTHDAMITEFADAAFAGQIGEIVGPVATSYGSHLIMIVGHEDRLLDETGIQQLINNKYQADLAIWENEADIEMKDNYKNRMPDSPNIPATSLAPLQAYGVQ